MSNIITDFIDNASAVIRQDSITRGVYDPSGHKIGSFNTLQDFCQGRWFLLAGETRIPDSDLRLYDFWGRLRPAQQYCLDHRVATTIAMPQQVQAQQQKLASEILPGVTSPGAISPATGQVTAGGVTIGQIAVVGGVGLALLLLLRRD